MCKRLVAFGQAVIGLVLAVSVCGLVGCAQNETSGGSGAASTEASEQTSEGAETGEDANATEQVTFEVPEGCLDRKGNLTVLALGELNGEQLLALLAQQEYVWSERNQLWTKEDGSAAFVALDTEGKPLGEEKVTSLGVGMDEDSVSYRLVASNYATPKRTFTHLVSGALESEDVEYTETNAIGIVRDEAGRRCLVFVSASNDVHVVNVYSEGAVEAGLFADAAGLEDVKTLDAAFERLVGRLPGAEL